MSAPTGAGVGAGEAEMVADLSHLKSEMAAARAKVTLFKSPVLYLKTMWAVICNLCAAIAHFAGKNSKATTALLLFIMSFVAAWFTPGDHQKDLQAWWRGAEFVGWWVGLGVLSSVGLGTGLHTFVLYLGPHIAKVAMAASECGHLDFPTHWTSGALQYTCEAVEGSVSAVSMMELFHTVWPECFLWGLGTALGELPPYFVAKAARLSGDDLEGEDAWFLEAATGDDVPTARPGETYFQSLQRRGLRFVASHFNFVTILLFASIPNPLFDLAGVTCGHLLVPFWTFFGATAIGKAVVKVSIQSAFVLGIFAEHHLENILETVEVLAPTWLAEKLNSAIANEKGRLHATDGSKTAVKSRGLLGYAWDAFLFLMIGYFVVSIANSQVQSYLADRDAEILEGVRENLSQSFASPIPSSLPSDAEEEDSLSEDESSSSSSSEEDSSDEYTEYSYYGYEEVSSGDDEPLVAEVDSEEDDGDENSGAETDEVSDETRESVAEEAIAAASPGTTTPALRDAGRLLSIRNPSQWMTVAPNAATSPRRSPRIESLSPNHN